jgi:CPA1 family monovalent cation:H+ antiporter
LNASFQIFIVLLALLAGGALAARRLNVAPAILFLALGTALAFVPGLPTIELPPELVLLVVLPPLIYSASVAMSWREFRANLRPIGLLAIGCVLFTACTVAAVTHFVIGLPWAIGFLLGAIVAPPDVVAPLAVARKLRLPRRVLVILEGEGLANDATALILYRFATAAIVTGTFSLPKATGTFGAIVIGEVLFGIAIGFASLRLRKWARDPKVEIVLSMITPYLAFWIPEHAGGSGVIATVACGLYISWNGPLLISSATRLQGVFFWDLTIYLIEGLLFLLTGLQMRLLIEKSKSFPLQDILMTTALVFVLVVVARFVWVTVATYLPRLLSPALRARDPVPHWKMVFVIGFTGVRGAVSLAAALALPLTMPNGEGFPHRDLILFVSFGVILTTMIGIGLTLPAVVTWLGISKLGREEAREEREAETQARRLAIKTTRETFEGIKSEKELSDALVTLLETRHETRSQQVHVAPKQDENDEAAQGAQLVRHLISEERIYLHQLLRDGKITDETRRRIERDLDLEEAIITNRETVWQAP